MELPWKNERKKQLINKGTDILTGGNDVDF
jgi:hypothetical protein